MSGYSPLRLGKISVLYFYVPPAKKSDRKGSFSEEIRMAKISQKQYEEYRRDCRSAYYGMNVPDYGYEGVGFRLALVPVR